MADGDFGGTEGSGFGFGDTSGFGTAGFGDTSADASGPGINFGDAGTNFGSSDFGSGSISDGGISFDSGLFASGIGTSLAGTGFSSPDYGLSSFASPDVYGGMAGPGFSFSGAPSSGAFGTSAFGGQQGGFANAMKAFMMNLMKGKAVGALGAKTGVPGFLINSLLAAMQAPKGQGSQAFGQSMAKGITSGLMGPFGMVDSLISQFTGQPSLAQSIGSHPGSPGGFAAAMGASTPSGPSGSWLPSLFNLGTGLYGMSQARDLARGGRPAASQTGADARMAAIMGGGNDYTSSPAYRQGEQAVMRQMAAQGYLGSGNMGTALSDYNRAFVNDELRLMNTLAQPRAGQLERQVGGMQLGGEALNRLGYGASQMLPLLRGMFSGGGGGGGDDFRWGDPYNTPGYVGGDEGE